MKKIIKCLFIFILLIPLIINASSFSTERGNVNNLLSRENYVNTKDKYILYGSNVKYNYQDRANKQISNFINGGFISIEEYRLTIVRNNSYLFDGVEYWTLTEIDGKYHVIAYDEGNTLQPDSANYRGRATEFVKSNVSVRGTGKRNDPWTFDPMYKVSVKVEHGTIVEGNNTFVKGNCNKTECTAQIKLAADDGYRYITNNCNGTYDATTQIFRVSNIKRDTVCNVVFGLGKYKLTLTGATPSYVYLKFEENFYTESDMQTIIRKLTSVPSQSGYRFKGYKCNQEGICNNVMVVDENKNLLTSALNKINGDVTIEPYMEPIQYTVTLDQQGATANGTTSVSVAYNSNMPAIAIPQKTGYTFCGYFTSTNGGGTQYYNADGTSSRTYNLTSNTTLYAKWTANTYSVKYNANGGSGTMSNSTHTYGTAKALTANAFTRSGYTFSGWATTSGGSVAYTNGQSVNNLTTTANGTVNLYAVWTINRVFIKYHMNGGTWAGSTSTHLGVSGSFVTYDGVIDANAFSVEYDGTMNLANWNNSSYINISKTGYSAKANAQWCTKTDGTGTCYDHAADYANVGTDATAATHFCDARTNSCTVTLYVNWVPNTYTVTYNNNSGSGCTTKSVTYASTYGTLCTPTRSGYTFKGCFKESGLTNQVTASTTVSTTSNHTLYAKWAANTYTVKFNGNGGTGSMSDITCTVGSNCTLTTNAFAKSGSAFVMWSTNSGTVAILNNTNTFSGECTSGEYKDFKEFTNIVKPSKNQKFGLDCDVKGDGRMENYFYGTNQTEYLQVASFTTSQGKSGTSKDGHNVIDTTDSYKHYHVDFTMGSSPESYENKKLLFRVKNGYSGSVKNIKFYRKVGSENIYIDGAKVKDIASGGSSITLYAIWIASGGSTGGWRLRCTYEIGSGNDPITQYYGSEADCNAAKAGYGSTFACTCSKV